MCDLGELHITVAATGEKGFNLQNEIRMLKSALLLGDRVTLVSPSSSIVRRLASFKDDPFEEQFYTFTLLAEITKLIDDDKRAILAKIRALIRKQHKSSQELIALSKLQGAFRNQEFIEKAEMIAGEANVGDLDKVISSGLVKVIDMRPVGDDPASEYLDNMLENLVVESTYPLVDDSTGGVLQAFHEFSKSLFYTDSTFERRSVEVGFHTALFSSLTCFEGATVDQIVDIRNELKPYLTRYRSSILSFSKEIDSMPWTSSFRAEAQQVYLECVAPAIEEMQEAFKANRSLRVLGEELARSKVLWGSALGVVVASIGDISSLTGQATVGLSVLLNTLLAARSRQKSQDDLVQAKGLFYVYKAGSMLNRPKG